MNRAQQFLEDTAKVLVHNAMEARALLKEWDAQGQYADQDIKFYTHDGKFIAISVWNELTQEHEEIL